MFYRIMSGIVTVQGLAYEALGLKKMADFNYYISKSYIVAEAEAKTIGIEKAYDNHVRRTWTRTCEVQTEVYKDMSSAFTTFNNILANVATGVEKAADGLDTTAREFAVIKNDPEIGVNAIAALKRDLRMKLGR